MGIVKLTGKFCIVCVLLYGMALILDGTVGVTDVVTAGNSLMGLNKQVASVGAMLLLFGWIVYSTE